MQHLCTNNQLRFSSETAKSNSRILFQKLLSRKFDLSISIKFSDAIFQGVAIRSGSRDVEIPQNDCGLKVESQSHESHEPPEPRCFFSFSMRVIIRTCKRRKKSRNGDEIPTINVPANFPCRFRRHYHPTERFISFGQNKRKLV